MDSAGPFHTVEVKHMIQEPILMEVAKDTYMINLMGLQAPSLIVGHDRALLLDTGLGNFDMMSLVRRVTDKPVMLVLSHAHSDHMGGIGQFEEIYLHPADMPAARAFDADRLIHEDDRHPTQKDFVAQAAASFRDKPGAIFDIPGTVVEDRFPARRFLPLQPDQIIDLGGRKVQILEERGHTAGEIAVLDFQSRILFAGDGISPLFSITEADIATARDDLLHIRAHANDFDRIYHGHFGGSDPAFLCSESVTLLDDILHILNEALDGTDPGQPVGDGSLRTRSYGGAQLYWYPPKQSQ